MSVLTCLLLLTLICYNINATSYLSGSEIDELREAIMNKIDTFSNEYTLAVDKKPLAASIVRLVFHDCAGPQNLYGTIGSVDNDIRICDGCIHLDLPDHSGLYEIAIDPLEDVYDQFIDRVNRADFWPAVGNIALEYTASLSTKSGSLPPLSYYFGRKECPLSPDGISSNTYFPAGHEGWDPAFDFLRYKMDLTLKETTAMFGAHSLGSAHAHFSGFHGLWTNSPFHFDNQFYIELFNLDNEWDQVGPLPDNDKYQFENKGSSSYDTEPLMMLNSDYCLLSAAEEPKSSPNINTLTGEITCRVRGFGLYDRTPDEDKFDQCTYEISYNTVRDFAKSNQMFYDYFVVAWNKMLINNQPMDDLIQVIPNTFKDNRNARNPTNKPSKRPTYSPTNEPTDEPTYNQLNQDIIYHPTDEPTDDPTERPTYYPTADPTSNPIEDGPTPYCCIANVGPNWNGRCWGHTDYDSCYNARPGNGERCHWDETRCKQSIQCALRGVGCSMDSDCCSETCRTNRGTCR